jgi:sugar phosphate permease
MPALFAFVLFAVVVDAITFRLLWGIQMDRAEKVTRSVLFGLATLGCMYLFSMPGFMPGVGGNGTRLMAAVVLVIMGITVYVTSPRYQVARATR